MWRSVAILLGMLAAAQAHAAEPSIVGVWYEDVIYGGSRQISIWVIKPDGTFTSLFRHCLPPPQEETDSTASGRWTYANGRVRTMETSAAGWPIVNEYQTESNDGHIWVYRGVAGDGYMRYGAVRFRDVKVEPGSKLPTCDLSS